MSYGTIISSPFYSTPARTTLLPYNLVPCRESSALYVIGAATIGELWRYLRTTKICDLCTLYDALLDRTGAAPARILYHLTVSGNKASVCASFEIRIRNGGWGNPTSCVA